MASKNSVYADMTNIEKIECAINKLRVFGSTTLVEELVEEEKDNDSLVVADSGLLKKLLKPMVAQLPDIDSMTFEGYFVDIGQNVYIKNSADAITEIARRLEQYYIYGNQAGNMLPSEYMDPRNLYTLAETDLRDYKYLRLLPVLVRVKFKGSSRRTILRLCDEGQNLLPYVIDDMHNIKRSDIEDVIMNYKKLLEEPDEEEE